MTHTNSVRIRQFEDFCTNLSAEIQHIRLLSASLVAVTAISIILTLMGLNVAAAFSAIAVTLTTKSALTLRSIANNFAESRIKYEGYLSPYHFRSLREMLNNPDLSSWSKSEITHYLRASGHLPPRRNPREE